jgi:hypothetical protein
MDIITQWTEPSTKIISDCYASCSGHKEKGYTHKTVNHSRTFVDEGKGMDMNTTVCGFK